MAKRKAAARSRKAVQKSPRKAARGRASSASTKRAGRTAAKRASRSASARRVTGKKTSRPALARAKKAAKPARPQASKSRAASRPKAATPLLPKRAAISRPKPAALSRERRQLREDEMVPSAPSTLGYAPKASQAESGQNMYHQKKREHTEGGPALTGGDIDSDWGEAYASGEETPGGDMPTPDQDVVEEIGRALGVEYEDAEELKGAEKIEDRDRHRWEYDPASAEDYRDRNRRDND